MPHGINESENRIIARESRNERLLRLPNGTYYSFLHTVYTTTMFIYREITLDTGDVILSPYRYPSKSHYPK